MRLLRLACLVLVLATPAAHAARNPDAVAVIIGNKAYQNAPEIAFADRDAEAMRRYVIDVLGYDEANVILVQNAGYVRMVGLFGTQANPRGQLARRLGATASDSDVFVYFSGHGFPGLHDHKGYLLPVDADAQTAEDTGYSLDLLSANLAGLGARSVTLVLDACFSGDSAAGPLLKDKSVLVRAADPPPPRPRLTVLAAAGPKEMANWDRADRHGAFTEFFLRAVYGGADDPAYGAKKRGRIVAADVKRYLDRQMSRWTARELDSEQTASLSGDETVVLAAFVPGRPPVRPTLDPAPAPALPAPPRPTPAVVTMPATPARPPRPVPPSDPVPSGEGASVIAASRRAVNDTLQNKALDYLKYISVFPADRGPTGRENGFIAGDFDDPMSIQAVADLKEALAKAADGGPARMDYVEMHEAVPPVRPLPVDTTVAPGPESLLLLARRYVEDAQALSAALAPARVYYAQQNYRDDKFAKGRAMHPGIISAYREFLATGEALRLLLIDMAPAEREAFLRASAPEKRPLESAVLRNLDQNRRIVRFIMANTPGGKDVVRIDPAGLGAGIEAAEKGLAELRQFVSIEPNIGERVFGIDGYYFPQYIDASAQFLNAAKTIWRAARDHRPLDSGAYPLSTMPQADNVGAMVFLFNAAADTAGAVR